MRDQDRITKSREGITMFRQNRQGRIASREALADKIVAQSHLCLKCGQYLELIAAKFENKTFEEGIENRAIHKECPV